MEKEVYILAEKKRKENKIEEAIPLYEFLTDNSNYNVVACNQLIDIFTKLSDFNQVRAICSKIADLNHPAYLSQLGYLEYHEMNYQAALKYFELSLKALKTKILKYQESYIYLLANIQKNYGEKKIAKNLYELLLNSENFGYRAFFSLCGLDLESQDYKQLENRINQANLDKFPKKERLEYLFFCDILNFYQERKKFKSDSYLCKRLIDNKTEDLLEHLERHRENSQKKYECGYFLKYIYLQALIKLAEKQISISNPYFETKSLNYIVSADSVIGMKNGKATNTFKVVTICGSPNIITMYPIFISEEFNREGFREDQTVLAKRLGGGQAK